MSYPNLTAPLAEFGGKLEATMRDITNQVTITNDTTVFVPSPYSFVTYNLTGCLKTAYVNSWDGDVNTERPIVPRQVFENLPILLGGDPELCFDLLKDFAESSDPLLRFYAVCHQHMPVSYLIINMQNEVHPTIRATIEKRIKASESTK